MLPAKESLHERAFRGGKGLPPRQRNAALSGVAALNKPIVNMAASVRQRLLNLARERKEDFGLVLTKYGLERVLYRIAQSKLYFS